MKIGREKITRLTQRKIASGIAYYWQPYPAERAKGWNGQPLGQDLVEAMRRARALNDEIDGWKNGGATKRAVKAHTKAKTFGALLDHYERDKLPKLAVNTQRVDKGRLATLREWAGDQPVQWITRARVRALRDAMMKHATVDGPGHRVAHHTLTVLRRVFSWAIKEHDLAITNPAESFDLPAPAARDQVWDQDDVAAFVAAAKACGLPSMALAVDLAAWTGQREDDLLSLSSRNWKEFPPIEATLRDALAGADGRVMGFELNQRKVNRWVGVPISGDLRDAVEVALAANARRTPAVPTVLLNDRSGRPWTQRAFIRAFVEVRDRAIADGHEPLASLQFRDLRRTCVVRLGRLGLNDAQVSAISGHKLETTKRILETYMPRDHHMAASAIVAQISGSAKASANRDASEKVGIPIKR